MLVVEENYANGVPQTAVRGFAPTGVGWHWSAGGAGRAGWLGSLRHLIATRLKVNASYHGGLWHEHKPDGACRTVIQWVVRVSKAAHSIAPSQVLRINANKDRATQNARFAEVRRILGAKAGDPNAACIAIAYAGMPLGLQKDLACPVFRADVQELARAVIAETSAIDRPHFGHGWIQPITRFEMDVATDFIGLLYEAPAIQEEDVDLSQAKHQIPKIVRIRGDAVLYRRSTGSEVHFDDPEDLGFDAELFSQLDNRWIGRRLLTSEEVKAREGLNGFFFFDDSAIDRDVPFRRLTYGANTAEEVAAVHQEWRDWLATAPAPASS